MAQEIERKFLVKDESFVELAHKSQRIVQAYICADSSKTVRIRRKGLSAFLTIKGKSSLDGLSRYEFEKEISIHEFEDLLELCEEGIIDKTRYLVNHKGKEFEVDVFHGQNKGLTIAEVELNSVDESVEYPAWLGKELTGDIRYYNSYLVKNPYENWNK